MLEPDSEWNKAFSHCGRELHESEEARDMEIKQIMKLKYRFCYKNNTIHDKLRREFMDISNREKEEAKR